jgi:hypothetical protein
MLGTIMTEVTIKKVPKKDYYRTAEIADVFEVTQTRIRQIRLELGLEPRDFGGIKLHSQEDFQTIADHMAQYKEIRIEFVEVA